MSSQKEICGKNFPELCAHPSNPGMLAWSQKHEGQVACKTIEGKVRIVGYAVELGGGINLTQLSRLQHLFLGTFDSCFGMFVAYGKFCFIDSDRWLTPVST